MKITIGHRSTVQSPQRQAVTISVSCPVYLQIYRYVELQFKWIYFDSFPLNIFLQDIESNFHGNLHRCQRVDPASASSITEK